jgi:hypothetical protein
MRNLRKTNPGAYKVIVGLMCFSVLLFGVLVWALWRVENFYQVDCHSRQEARDGVRVLVLAVTEPQDFNGDGTIDTHPDDSNPFIHYLKGTLQPGGAFERINC